VENRIGKIKEKLQENCCHKGGFAVFYLTRKNDKQVSENLDIRSGVKGMKMIESIKKMKITKKLLLSGFILVLLVSCAKDIIVEPPTSLRGFYIGKYYVSHALEGATITKDDEVEWTFTDQQHFCDFIVAEGTERLFCDFSGSYSVEANLNITVTDTANQICMEEDIPSGVFSVQWIRVEEGNDTLIIEQTNYLEDYRKRAVLEKQPEPEDL